MQDGFRAQALRHPQADRARDARIALHLRALVEDADLQGHADRVADRGHVPRSVRPERRIRARARAPALLDQHVPVLAAGASVSLRRAQRRDQHAARQHQLDEGARRPAQVERVRRRPAEGAAGDRARRQRHRDLRQRARVPGDGGTLAAARGADDDPGAVVRQPGDGSGGARVLRIPLVADGTVGRSGVDHLHRRPADRRRARSQRPAPVALLHHQGRPRDHGVGSRRPRHPRREHRRQGSPAPGQDAADRYRRGPHHQRRRDQADAGRRASVRRVAAPAPRRHREPADRARRASGSPDRAPPPAGVRLHAGRPARAADADGAERRRADRLDGHRHRARGAVEQAAAALRLLQAALRAGHQSAARCDSRRAGHVDGRDDRRRRQPARAAPRGVPADQGRLPGAPQRSGREASPPAAGIALPIDDACRCCTTRRKTAPASSARWNSCAARRASPSKPASAC